MAPSRSGDRLSELPDSLIFEIFWFLPLSEVVRTTILSKRWKGLWKTTPFLNIEDSESHSDYMTNEVADRFRALGNGALILWRGTEILRLKINFYNSFSQPFYHDVNAWVLLAMENGAEEVDLNLGVGYSVPHCLYSCSSLKVLSLSGFHLRIDGNVKWDQLKSLTIGSRVVSESVVNLILSGSPRLEVFALNLEDSEESLCIRSSSLRKLSIHKWMFFGPYALGRESLSTNTELKIWIPNLEWLEISGSPYSKCLLMDVSSLTHAGFKCFDPELKMWDYLLEVALGRILPSIDGLQSVTLSDWFIKVLGIMKRKHMLSPLSNVKLLKLDILPRRVEDVAGLLEYFPNVKRLVLKYAGYRNQQYQNGGNLLEFEFEPDLPNLFLLQLRTVEITWDQDNSSIFPLIRILLKYASKLEKMVFQASGTRFWGRSDSFSLAWQEVLKMPRSSPAVELILCEN